MTSIDRASIRSLDPVDPSAPPPDGSRLLQAVLAAPRPASARRTGGRLLQLVPVGLAVALAIGIVAVAISGGDGTADEQEAAAGSGAATIIHYVVRESRGDPDGRPEVVSTQETWQRDDGSRARTVSDWKGTGPLEGTTSEDVVTRTQLLAYRPSSEQEPAKIIRYRAGDDFEAIPEDPPAFGAPPIGGSAQVGDPRTLPDRLADGDGDGDVKQLPDATVRGIAVERFQVGECDESGRAATLERQRAIVSLARDTRRPVRVTYTDCGRLAGLDARILDFMSFEELPQTSDNLKQLELSPHPGVPVVDGIEIDKAEERDEAGPAPTPTPR